MALRVGENVEVGNGMWGTVKFVGNVEGKRGTFCGVQLAPEFATKGKNNGDVDGRTYFRTTKPGSGIFLPIDKAVKRGPATPQGQSLSFNVGGRTPSVAKFSQSVGPGARVASPALKPTSRRPSLPRPGSPLRKPPTTAPSPAVRPSPALSKSRIGGSRYGSGTTPSPRMSNLGASLRAASSSSITPSKKQLGPEASFDEEESTPTPTPIGVAKSIDHSVQSEEMKRLKASLEEKDRHLKDQASALADMEASLTELQSLLPEEGRSPTHARGNSTAEPSDVKQLRAMLRDKNEKIALLTAEFDSHRADFRSTIDTLEMAGNETERVYEKKVEDLMSEIRELQEGQEDVTNVAQQLKQLEEVVQELEEGLEDSRRGEAEARSEVEFLRGEVERGKAELRREKEKSAAALRDAAISPTSVDQRANGRDLEQRDDEIRGLKAIITGLSRDSMLSPPGMNGYTNGHSNISHTPDQVERLSSHIEDLENALEQKAYREEELEREVEHLRNSASAMQDNKHKSVGTIGSHRLSDRTITQGEWREPRDPALSSAPAIPRQQLETMHEATGDSQSTVTDGSALWCEICETGGHDILGCTNMFGNGNGNDAQQKQSNGTPNSQRTGRDVVVEGLKGLSHATPRPPPKSSPRDYNNNMNNNVDAAPTISTSAVESPTQSYRSPLQTPKAQPNPISNPLETYGTSDMAPGKTSGVIDPEKWCALCEKDGHESVDCPFEDAF
ncbi:MAG: hypothetical protein Q9160_007274 [Pyrenula sp. 1 TL-2023]